MPSLATAILTVRVDDAPARRANLDAALARLARMPAIGVLVVEQGSLPAPVSPRAHASARSAFAYNPGELRTGWGLNVGALAAGADILVFGDPDVLPPSTLDTAVAHAARGWALVKPTRGRIVVPAPEVARVRAMGREGAVVARSIAGEPEDDVLCGGWFVIRAATYARLGGFDERFPDGLERLALSWRVERLRVATLELDDEPAIRLAGPPRDDDGAARALQSSLDGLDDDALARLAQVQAQSGGRRDKYRPSPGSAGR